MVGFHFVGPLVDTTYDSDPRIGYPTTDDTVEGDKARSASAERHMFGHLLHEH